ncbi:transposase, partial [Streptomyces sp. NPDC020480]|uniref:IS701 family transposase n=1 Tax=Streptomyces sp. NPDC020480 TaxID=3365076 RepID=UPI0037A478C1
HHARAHRLFSCARWSADEVGLALAAWIVERILPDDAPLLVAVDDTLFKRSGRKVFGAAWLHVGSARGPRPAGFGNCWVVAGIVVTVPFLARPVCLPVLARLWRPRHTGKIALAREMAERIAAHFPDRTVHMVGDAAYVGEHLRGLPTSVSWTSRMKVTSVLHELPPPRTGKKGRPRTKGARLGTPAELARLVEWRRIKVRRYGRTSPVFLAERICLWYGSFHTRPIRVVLVWDERCGPGTGLDRGYGAALVTTDLTTPAEQIAERYASRSENRDGLLRRPPDSRCRRGPQPHTARGRTYRTLRPVRPDRGDPLVHTRRPSAHRCRRTPVPGPLVHHKDPALLRGHDRQTPPRHHRPPFSRPTPSPGNTPRNPGRPHRLGRRRNMTTQNREAREAL